MSDPRATTSLMRCPDCGGILEPHRHAWASTIDVVAALDVTDNSTPAWRCLLCGYQDDVEGETGVSTPSTPSL